MKKILVVDDEADILELVSYNLRKEGFDSSTASDGEEALKKIRENEYDLLILDLMLPGIQGMELCRIVRNEPRTKHLPIIMLTAKGEEIDRVLGLESGADDYITKPFGPRELVARVKTVLRRLGQKEPEGDTIRVGDLSINKATYSVSKHKKTLTLSSTEFRLLLYLAERRGKVFSREQLLDSVWRGETYVEPRTVDVHIRRLRTQVEDDASDPKYIKTKRGIGYYMAEEL